MTDKTTQTLLGAVGSILLVVFACVMIGFWRWTAVRLIELQLQMTDIRGRVTAIEATYNAYDTWLGRMDKKLNKVAEDTAFIRGKLEPRE